FSVNYLSTPAISTLSLHDALPIYFCTLSDLPRPQPRRQRRPRVPGPGEFLADLGVGGVGRGAAAAVGGHQLGQVVAHLGLGVRGDRKSTRLNSSHVSSSYAVFCTK